jgi:hypothetical protein
MPEGDTRKQEYARVLPVLLRPALVGEPEPLENYLADHSNLPGPAGNFTLLHSLADLLVSEAVAGHETAVWDLLERWASLSPDIAPANSPPEFLPFAAALAHGLIGAAREDYFGPAIDRLRAQARDPRWRTREMVAQGLQALARARFGDLPELVAFEGLGLAQAGDEAAALALLQPLAEGGYGKVVGHCAYFALKLGDLAAAERFALAATELTFADQAAWACLSIVWRLTGDPREQWLADYDRLVMPIDLNPPQGFVDI